MCFKNTIVGVCIVVSITLRIICCENIKLYQTNGRVMDVTKTQKARSVLECSLLYEMDEESLSFNYNEDTKMCELSQLYLEGSTTALVGWNVYINIVHRGWSTWQKWTSCSVTCANGTRSRTRTCSNPSPSNGGQRCQGHAVENIACNDCLEASHYYFGPDNMQHSEAVALCEGMSARLVIIESQEEIDFLSTQVQEFFHWIGMKCTSSGDGCTWDDGRDVDSGFTAWAPEQPSGGMECVYIGYLGSLWDDFHCFAQLKPLCEFY